jgi:cell division protein ZapA
MASVNVTINGRQFRIACDDGQEAGLEALARDLDERVEKLRGNFGEIGDTRLTVMVAIQVADELNEMRKRLRGLEEEVAALKDARVMGADRAKAAQDAVTSAFNSAAERIEGLTKKLNQTVGQGVAIG